MKLRDLRYGEGDVVSSWPPAMWSCSGVGPLPTSATGKLLKVEAVRAFRGVAIQIEYEGNICLAHVRWNGDQPLVDRVVAVLSARIGEDLAGLGKVDLI